MNEAIDIYAGILTMIIFGVAVLGGLTLMVLGIIRLVRGPARRRMPRARRDRYQQIDVKPDHGQSG